MYVVDFNNPNFELNSFLNASGIEGLENISEFINFGIHSTITKQMGNVRPELEARYAQKLLNNHMNGNTNAFTNSNGIRATIHSIDPFKIKALLIKSAIERHAFSMGEEHKISFESDAERLSQAVTELLANDDITNVLTWIDSDSRVVEILVESYVALSYQSDKELRDAYDRITNSHPETAKALLQLNLELSLHKINSKQM